MTRIAVKTNQTTTFFLYKGATFIIRHIPNTGEAFDRQVGIGEAWRFYESATTKHMPFRSIESYV